MATPSSYLTTTFLAFNTDGSVGTGGTLGAKLIGSAGTISFASTDNSSTVFLSNVKDPLLAQDAATKAYVDSLAASGVTWKNAVQAASTNTIDLTTTGVGATVDGVVLTLGDRILVKNQQGPTAGANTANGIYLVNAGAWTRSSDATTSTQASGVAVYVIAGTVYNGEAWVCNTTSGAPNYDPVNFGASIEFVQMSANPAIAGSNTQVQYNDNGGFGASANFTFASNTLTVNGTVSTGGLTASGQSSLQGVSASQVVATNVTTVGLNATGTSSLTTITAGTLNVSGLSSLQNVAATGVSVTVLNATTITAGTLSVSGNSALTNVTSSNIVATNISVGTLNVANPVTFTSLTVSNLFVTSGSITNLVNTSATSGSITVTGLSNLQNVTATGVSATVLNSTTITAGTLNVSGLSSVQNVTATGVSATVLNSTTITAGTLNASGLSSLQNVTATGVSSTVLNSTTITAGTLNVSGLSSVQNVTATGVSATVLNATTITAGAINASGVSNFRQVFLGDGTQASDASTGALVVNGGIAASRFVTAQQFNAVSDVQFKTNIEPLHDSLATLKRIEGYSYNWKDSYAPGEKRQIGVLAQQLEEIGLDDLVNNMGSSKSVNYIGIIPILVEALKELSEKVDRFDPQDSEKKTIKLRIKKN